MTNNHHGWVALKMAVSRRIVSFVCREKSLLADVATNPVKK